MTAAVPTPSAFAQRAWDDTIPAHYEACVVPVLEMLAPLAALHDAELNIVDLGCGAGRLAFPAAMAMPEATIIGVDVSRAALAALEDAANALGVATATFTASPGAGRTAAPPRSRRDSTPRSSTARDRSW